MNVKYIQPRPKIGIQFIIISNLSCFSSEFCETSDGDSSARSTDRGSAKSEPHLALFQCPYENRNEGMLTSPRP
jgi:hypothetical protein